MFKTPQLQCAVVFKNTKSVMQKNVKTPRKIQKGKSLIKWQNQKLKHIKRMDNNCHTPVLLQAFSYVETRIDVLVAASYYI